MHIIHVISIFWKIETDLHLCKLMVMVVMIVGKQIPEWLEHWHLKWETHQFNTQVVQQTPQSAQKQEWVPDSIGGWER